jgi:hypothetical protein
VTLPMGLKSEGSPDPVHRLMGQMCCLGHGADRPMRAVFGYRIERFAHQNCYLLVADAPRTSGLHFIMQSLSAAFDEALAPQTDRLLAQVQFLGNGIIGQALPCQAHHLGPPDKSMRHRA